MAGTKIQISIQAGPASQRSWCELARRCEQIGMRSLLVSDHPGVGPSPFVALAAAASVTTTLRLGSYVVNAGVRHPLLLASDVATLDVLSDGRAEVGIGAGHTPAEWEMVGLRRPAPAERVANLEAVATATRELLAGRRLPKGTLGAITDIHLEAPRPVQAPVPMLVGGANPGLLSWAGAHADAVGLSGLGRTRSDGYSHGVSWSQAQVDRHVRSVRMGAEAAGRPTPPVEVLVQAVDVTGQRETSARALADRFGVPVEDLLSVPYVLVGSAAEIVDQMHAARERWGITRWVMRQDALAAAEVVTAHLRR